MKARAAVVMEDLDGRSCRDVGAHSPRSGEIVIGLVAAGLAPCRRTFGRRRAPHGRPAAIAIAIAIATKDTGSRKLNSRSAWPRLVTGGTGPWTTSGCSGMARTRQLGLAK
jgi:hypothetical protein